jgi:DNA-binding NtrC family response regulator
MILGKNRELHILHIEDSPRDAAYIRELLSGAKHCGFFVQSEFKLAEGLKVLAEKPVDAVLLDLMLSDSSGMDTFVAVKEAAPELPVIIMTGLADEAGRCRKERRTTCLKEGWRRISWSAPLPMPLNGKSCGSGCRMRSTR